MKKRTPLLRLLPTCPPAHEEKPLYVHWRGVKKARRRLLIAEHRHVDTHTLAALSHALRTAEADYIEAAFDKAGVPSILRRPHEARIPNSKTGEITLVYGDLDPNGDLHGHCEVHPKGRVTHLRTPYEEDVPEMRDLLAIL